MLLRYLLLVGASLISSAAPLVTTDASFTFPVTYNLPSLQCSDVGAYSSSCNVDLSQDVYAHAEAGFQPSGALFSIRVNASSINSFSSADSSATLDIPFMISSLTGATAYIQFIQITGEVPLQFTNLVFTGSAYGNPHYSDLPPAVVFGLYSTPVIDGTATFSVKATASAHASEGLNSHQTSVIAMSVYADKEAQNEIAFFDSAPRGTGTFAIVPEPASALSGLLGLLVVFQLKRGLEVTSARAHPPTRQSKSGNRMG